MNMKDDVFVLFLLRNFLRRLVGGLERWLSASVVPAVDLGSVLSTTGWLTIVWLPWALHS